MFNVGRKDEYGKQRRIEHRGRYLRASRTGGVALRAQTKAAGVNLTGNTHRGVRVSATPAKNTQVAVQNGRFILRGRYSAGPMRLNLSKSGLSLSARNAMGSFNLSNPGRSSAKVAGVQVRGKTAAQIQAVYSVFLGLGLLIKFTAYATMFLFRLIVTVVGGAWNALVAIPGVLSAIRRGYRNFRLRGRVRRWARNHSPWPEDWDAETLQAALVLAYIAWGHGYAARTVTTFWAEDPEAPTQPEADDLARWQQIAEALDTRLSSEEGREQDVRTVFAALTQRITDRIPDEARAELLFQADELAEAHGPRTRRQEILIEIYCDFAGLRLDVDPEAHPEPDPEESVGNRDHTGDPGAVDINTAPLEMLTKLPNIGEERAREIIAQRPFRSLDELQAIHGIGEGTVEQLREAGVRCE